MIALDKDQYARGIPIPIGRCVMKMLRQFLECRRRLPTSPFLDSFRLADHREVDESRRCKGEPLGLGAARGSNPNGTDAALGACIPAPGHLYLRLIL